MRHFSLIPPAIMSLLLAWVLLPLASAKSGAYISLQTPTNGTQWVNGQTNPVVWQKGVYDGLGTFDIELARLSTDGIIYIAKQVAAADTSLNIHIDSIPVADDYFLLFINSTHGIVYEISDRFSVVDSSSASSTASPVSTATTVSISGGPNPTVGFAQTFAAVSGAVQVWAIGRHLWMVIGTMCICLVAGATALL